jgi:alpha-tubulin suppressor-like RCC1 family protein
VQVGALTNWLVVESLSTSTKAIKTDGTLWSWGKGNDGQSGLGNTTNYSSPKQVGTLTTWTTIGCGWGGSFVLAIKTT